MRLSTAAMVAGVLMAMGVALWWPNDRQPAAIRTAQAQAPVTSAVAKVDSSIEVNNQATREKLAQRIKVEYVGVPATDVLLDLKEKLKIEFYVDDAALSLQAIELDAPIVTMRFEKIRGDMLLDLLVQHIGSRTVDYVIRDGIVIITTVESLDESSEVKAYPVSDLLQLHSRAGDGAPPMPHGGGPGFSGGPGSPMGGAGPVRIVDTPLSAQQLINVISNTVAPDTWANVGGNGGIEYYGGMLVVRQNARTHREVEKFLAMLRETAAQHERDQQNGERQSR